MSDRDLQVARIQEKLAEVRARRPDTFGGGGHRFELGPPLGEDEVRAFELERGVTLPPGYRAFIRQIGHGGPGKYGGAAPYYGLYGLEAWGQFHDWVGMDEEPEWLRRPSLLRPGSNPLPGDEDDEDDDDWPPAELRQMYDGMLTLGTRGCSFMTALIVTGECRGRVVYVDASHVEDPYVGRDADFLDWYERWLDELLDGTQHSWFGYGPGGGLEELMDLVATTTDRLLRLEAVRNLRRVVHQGDPWERLVPLLEADDDELRAAVASVFAAAPNSYADAVGALLADPDGEVRRTVCSVVLELDASGYAGEVRSALFRDPSLRVRTDAFFALRRVDALGQADLLAIVSDPAMAELRASAAYHVEWTPAQLGLLDALAADPSEDIRRIAANARASLARD